MKKLFLFGMMCLLAISMQAQRCAVLGFEAGANLSVRDIDGISETFSTYFRPAGYTMVERAQIDKVLSEQRFQLSKYTQEQMVKLGEILNVSKVVIGKIYISRDGGYQVDVRVVDAQTGTQVAADGTTVRGDFRQNIKKLAQDLAAQIAIRSGSTVPTETTTATTRTRSTVEVLYGYLKIFPNELGVFQAEPTSVIAQINKQAQHGYNNWRIPTNEELSLMRANNYLGGGEYMSRESKHGIVLLVTDGKDYATLLAEEQERARIRAEQEQKRKAEQERRAAELKAQGFVDLGLPSGTLWRDRNEEGGFYTYEQAMNKFGDKLPTKEQLEELKNKCSWSWTGNGYKVTGPNGNSIVLPASGYRNCYGNVNRVGSDGDYWSSTPVGSDRAWYLRFNSGEVSMDYGNRRCYGISVRLVQDK